MCPRTELEYMDRMKLSKFGNKASLYNFKSHNYPCVSF
jgi:hypothetical protein